MKSGEAMIVVLMPSIGDWQKAIAFLLSDISARNQVFNDIEFVAKSIERKQKTAPRSRIDYFVCVLDNDLLNELINNPDITKYNYLDFRLRNVIGCLHRQREQARAAQATN
ncbi:MAG: hypothetical protein Q8O98_00700 [bacterium]|nr:hypothetical protein [bacterium]